MARKRDKGFKLKRDPKEFETVQLKRVKAYLNSRACFYLCNGEIELYVNVITIVNRINIELKERKRDEIKQIYQTNKAEKI